MTSLRDLRIEIAYFSAIYVFISSLTMLPSYLYRFVWRVLWYNWSPIYLTAFLAFISPLFWRFIVRRIRLEDVHYQAISAISLILLSLLPIFYDLVIRGLLISIALAMSPPLLYWILRNKKGGEIGVYILLMFMFEITFRAFSLGFDFRLTYVGLFFGFCMTMVILYNIIIGLAGNVVGGTESREGGVETMKVDYLSMISLIVILFIFINLFSKANTLLRIIFRDYYLIHFASFSAVLILSIALSLISLWGRAINRSILYLGNILIAVVITLMFAVGGLVSVLLVPFAIYFLSVDVFVVSSNLQGHREFYFTTLLDYLMYLLMSLLYTFVFVYPYLPGIYFFGKKSFELFFTLFLVFMAIFNYWVWDREGILSLKLSKSWVKGIILISLVFAGSSFSSIGFGSYQPLQANFKGNSIRVMSYNIHQGFDLWDRFSVDGIVEVIRDSGADIIGLQEVDTGRITSDYVDNLVYIVSKLGYYAVYEPAIGGTYGVAVVSRFPLEKVKSLMLSSLGEQRVLLHVRVDLGFAKINFITLHLGLDHEERLIQVTEVVNYLRNVSGPIVLVGDFNSWPNSSEIEVMKKYLFDSRELAEEVVGPSETWPSLNPSERIDYIFVNGYFEVNRFETINTTASDHLPIIADLSLSSPIKIHGSMYANDAGEPKGGFEWAAQYNATMLIFDRGVGFLNLSLTVGLGDPLQEHVFLIENFDYNTSHMWFTLVRLDGSKKLNVTLRYYDVDSVWGIYNGYYIAYYVDPSFFPGFQPHYYVELRLKIEGRI